MKKPNDTATNQLRFSMPWHGDATRCRGCKYLAEIGKGLWQCTGSRDAYGVVSDGALCVAKRSDSKEDRPYKDASRPVYNKESLIKEEFEENQDLCSRCGAILPTRGCSCYRCGYREC